MSDEQTNTELGNEDLAFRSDAHAWATGLSTGALMGHPDLFRARPMRGHNDRSLPQVLVTVGGYRYSVVIEELQ